MATVRDYLRGHLGETYERMIAAPDGKYDGEGDDSRPDIFGQAIESHADRLFVDGTKVEDLGEFVKSHLGAIAALDVITGAIDFMQNKTRLNDSIAGPGTVPHGGESSQNYDRVQGLERIAVRLEKKISRESAEFVAIAGLVLRSQAEIVPSGMRISTSEQDHLTPDPAGAFESTSDRLIVRVGVPIIVREQDY